MTVRPHGPGRSHIPATLLFAICFAASCDDGRSMSGEAGAEERASVSPGTRAEIPALFVSLPLEKLVERGIDLHYSGEYDSARVVFWAGSAKATSALVHRR